MGSSAILVGGGGGEVLPEGWHTVYFIVDKMMASTLVERPYAGGQGEDSSSVLVNRRWLNLT